MSNTPRTDAARAIAKSHGFEDSLVHYFDMLKLETELTEVEHKLAEAERQARVFYALSEERGRIIEQARAELATTQAFIAKAFDAHPNLDLDIRCLPDKGGK